MTSGSQEPWNQCIQGRRNKNKHLLIYTDQRKTKAYGLICTVEQRYKKKQKRVHEFKETYQNVYYNSSNKQTYRLKIPSFGKTLLHFLDITSH